MHRPFAYNRIRMRHLFFDDHIIDRTTMIRRFHRPVPHAASPILGVETELERTGLRYLDAGGFSPPMACTFDDGVFYDEADGLFKMWYCAGSGAFTALATSRDGLHWERPVYDVVSGSNAVLVHEPGAGRDSFSPWIDAADPGPERYKAFLFTTNHTSFCAVYVRRQQLVAARLRRCDDASLHAGKHQVPGVLAKANWTGEC